MQNSHEGHLKVTRGLAEQPDTGPGGRWGGALPTPTNEAAEEEHEPSGVSTASLKIRRHGPVEPMTSALFVDPPTTCISLRSMFLDVILATY